MEVTRPKVTNGTTNPHMGSAASSIAVARKDQSMRLHDGKLVTDSWDVLRVREQAYGPDGLKEARSERSG